MLYDDDDDDYDSFCIQNKLIRLQSLVFVVVSTFYSIPLSRICKCSGFILNTFLS
jgi:hypothetical protein